MDLWRMLHAWGARADESGEARAKRAMLIAATSLGVLCTFVQACVLGAGGWVAVARFQQAQAVVFTLTLLTMPLHRSLVTTARLVILNVSGGAIVVAWVSGDLVTGASCAFWGMLGPLGAALLLSRLEALVDLVVFCAAALALAIAMPVSSTTMSLSEGLLRYLIGGNITLVTGFVTLTVLYLVDQRARAMHQLADEHDRSERLLLNVLPPTIARRLKAEPGTIADRFDEATILFADIVGFTALSATVKPEQLVMMLNTLFTEFDKLAEKHKLEKIKTIGDAYMVVGGIPEAQPDHAVRVAEMALDMLAVLRRHQADTGRALDVRIGINTGPVVAGVIGSKKFIYDLWGDAVNTASRMESHGIGGGIQVSESTFVRIHDRFVLEDRGAITVKGKGEMRTWLLKGRAADPPRA